VPTEVPRITPIKICPLFCHIQYPQSIQNSGREVHQIQINYNFQLLLIHPDKVTKFYNCRIGINPTNAQDTKTMIMKRIVFKSIV
jgi:hypothetical protein